ncbi:MAG: hypothetical protein ABSF34_18360 [Verrucomicrobiota bacterium]
MSQTSRSDHAAFIALRAGYMLRLGFATTAVRWHQLHFLLSGAVRGCTPNHESHEIFSASNYAILHIAIDLSFKVQNAMKLPVKNMALFA